MRVRAQRRQARGSDASVAATAASPSRPAKEDCNSERSPELDSISVARSGESLVVDNRRARHDYHLLEPVEAGPVHNDTAEKSLRDGRASLQQAYAYVRDAEAWLVRAQIW